MAKVTQFIITMTSNDNGQITVENSFKVDSKEATFADVTTAEKYNICQALQGSLGNLAKITMLEMKAEQKKKKEGKQ